MRQYSASREAEKLRMRQNRYEKHAGEARGPAPRGSSSIAAEGTGTKSRPVPRLSAEIAAEWPNYPHNGINDLATKCGSLRRDGVVLRGAYSWLQELPRADNPVFAKLAVHVRHPVRQRDVLMTAFDPLQTLESVAFRVERR